jgi:hypothetical protein
MVTGGQGRAAGRRMRCRPALAGLAVLVVTALSTAGCVSMPTGGPVGSFPVTQGPDAQSNPYVQIQPQKPRDGWSPKQIVEGFLTASASFGTYDQVALQYLTPAEQKVWDHPTGSAIVYKKGPDVADPVYPAAAKAAKTAKGAKTAKATPTPTPTPTPTTTATVQVTGTVQATLSNYSYSVVSTSAASSTSDAPPTFQLVKLGGQWRISYAPLEYLLTGDSFANDYQQRNLYFFDPTGTYLVPDPIYVPVRAPGDLMNGLVRDLISPPPGDWLSGGATKTAFPAGTKLIGVTVDTVTAIVNLTGPIAKASDQVIDQVMPQVASQLLWTLSGAGQGGPAGQGVTLVEVELNGHLWYPPGSQDNPVIQRQSTKKPATGASLVDYYYVDSEGYLTSRQGTSGKKARVEQIGTKYTQVAISPDGKYLAALLQDGTLYTGLIPGPLEKRNSGYTTMSWDANDDLWAALGTQVIMFRATVTLRQQLGPLVPVPVTVTNYYGGKHAPMQLTALRVAPDGVRVALVFAGGALTFGAISGQDGQNPQIKLSQVSLSPLNADEFTGLTWYGPDNVIALATPGPSATEYPVSGGSPTSLPAEADMLSITATSGNVLIAGLSDGLLAADNNLTGAWMPLGLGSAPAYPG